MPATHRVISRPAVTIAVLAGGRGSRMNGADKGLLRLNDRPLIHHALCARPAGVPALVVANRNLATYRALGWPVIGDPWPDFRGPLAGMLAALRAARTPWVQTLPCDGVCLPPNLIDMLLKHAVLHGARGAWPVSHGRGQFTCALLHQDLKPSLEAALERGERAPRRWLATVEAQPVSVADPEHALIWSVNDEKELRHAARRMNGREQAWA